MLHSEQAGVLVLEIPKTGTVSMSRALKGVCRQMRELPRHLGAHRARTEFGKAEWDRLHTFAVVREPTAWLQSWYRYLIGKERLDESLGFETFVQLIAAGELIDGKRIVVGSQFERISDRRSGDVIVKELLCFEYLGDEYDRLNTNFLAGAAAPLPRANVSPRVHTDSPQALTDLINQHWAKDLKIWSAVKQSADSAYSSAA